MPPTVLPDPWTRRRFVQTAATAAAALSGTPKLWAAPAPAAAVPPAFPDARPIWRALWEAAHATLAGNIQTVPKFDQPVLLEGAVYAGVWQECGPLEGLVYASLDWGVQPRAAKGPAPAWKAAAIANHMAFFALQKEDGQLPASVKKSEVGYGQIQMVVPIAATALEIAQLTGDHAFLKTAYEACGRWDAWLRRYRDTRGTGLVEGFCTYDTGMDNSPRWKGVPNRCPDADARKGPSQAGMPRLCPDLSATVYGGRVALAKMADALGRKPDAARWRDDAERLRRRILDKLWCEEDASFYDLDAEGEFVRVRSVVNCRVLGEHVLQLETARDRHIFDRLWERQLSNPKAFWSAYPFPSSALDDPTFVRPIPRNSWGGAAQALTALRTPRWMPHYGKAAEHRVLMAAWMKAFAHAGEQAQSKGEPLANAFRQQMDPLTGEFTTADPGGYSPAALVYLDFARRLAGRA